MIDKEFLDMFVSSTPDTYCIEVGRGCPFSCTYCCTNTFWRKKFRLKSVQNIISEIQTIKYKYGFKDFAFEHDLFTCNRDLVVNFCENLKKMKLDITWGCSARIDTIDKELIDIMVDSGLRKIFIGIESGSEFMQKNLKKNLNLDSIIEKISYLRQKNVFVTCSFIYGFIQETEEDINKTLNLIDKLYSVDVNNIQYHRFRPFSGTEEFYKCENHLVYELDKINVHVSEIAFIENVSTLIINNMSIFSNFYTLSTKLIEDIFNLDTYSGLLYILKNYYKVLYHVLKAEFENDLLNIYYTYKNIITDSNNRVKSKQNTDNMLWEFISDLITCINDISKDVICKTQNNILSECMNLGNDMIKFFKNLSRQTCIFDYNINVVKLQLNPYLSYDQVDEKITVQMFKKDHRTYVKRIK